jgi:hypothetical protein
MSKSGIIVGVAVVLLLSGGIIYKRYKKINKFSYLDECFI